MRENCYGLAWQSSKSIWWINNKGKIQESLKAIRAFHNHKDFKTTFLITASADDLPAYLEQTNGFGGTNDFIDLQFIS